MTVRYVLLFAAVLTLALLAGCMEPNAPPVARFTATPSTGQAPLFVSFDASSSTDSDGYVAAYTWAFGDGSSGSGITASHTYDAAGYYSATLVVRDDQSNTDTVTHAVNVAASPAPVTPVVLNFSGSAGMLTDPFTLPAGTYRVTLTTTGFCIVHVVPVANPSDFDYLFNVFAGDATNGESKLYVSTGGRFMLEFSNITAPFTLEFERIT